MDSQKVLRLGKGEFWALASALAYALDNVFAAQAVRGAGLHPYLGAFLRAVPVLIFALFMSLSAKKRNPVCVSPFSNWKLLAALASYGVLTFAIANPMLFAAFQAGGVLVATPVAGTQVLWGAICAALLLREPFNRHMLAGILVSLVGVAVLAWGRSSSAGLSEGWWLAIPLAGGTALGWALAGVLITYAMRRGVDRFQALGIALVIGLVCLNGVILVTGNSSAYTSAPLRSMLNVVLAGLFNMAALVSVITALSLTSVASASTISSLQVGFAPLIAWIFTGEKMNLPVAAGTLTILLGVIVVQRARGK